MIPNRDELRRLAESQQCWTHPQASVMPLLLAVPTLLDQLAATEARVARLLDALTPFAEYAKATGGMRPRFGDDEIPSDQWLPGGKHLLAPTVGNCRAALRALEETQHGT